MTARVPDDEPCPRCGRWSEREVIQRERARVRAESKLTTELVNAGLPPMEIHEIRTGRRPVPRLAADLVATLPEDDQEDQ